MNFYRRAFCAIGLCATLSGCLSINSAAFTFCPHVLATDNTDWPWISIDKDGVSKQFHFDLEAESSVDSRRHTSHHVLPTGYIWISFYANAHNIKAIDPAEMSATYDYSQAVLEVDGKAYHPAPHVWGSGFSDYEKQTEFPTPVTLTARKNFEIAFPVSLTKESKVRLLPGVAVIDGVATTLPPVDYRFCGHSGSVSAYPIRC